MYFFISVYLNDYNVFKSLQPLSACITILPNIYQPLIQHVNFVLNSWYKGF